MKVNATQQFLVLFRQAIRSELANRERLLSPFLFAAVILIVFAFAFGQVPPELATHFFLAQTFLTAFFALQVCLSRIFEAETADGAFDLLRTYPISAEAWFLAKYLVVLTYTCLVTLSIIAMSEFFFQSTGVNLSLLGLAGLMLVGLSAVGTLLAGLMLRSDARQILFPLIYFPLTVPVLLAGVQGGLSLADPMIRFADLLPNWVGLLLVFDAIYVTLGILLFSEMIKAD